MEFITALVVGALVGWASPLVGRSTGRVFVDMLVGAIGGFVGAVLGLVVPVNGTLLVIFGAAFALALVTGLSGRVQIAKSS